MQLSWNKEDNVIAKLEDVQTSVFPGEGVTDALLAIGSGQDVVDASLDLLDRVQVPAVGHCLVDLVLAVEKLSDAAASSLNWVSRGKGSKAGEGKQSKGGLHFERLVQTFEGDRVCSACLRLPG